MASFGEHLRQIRELKGLSVEDVSRASKINPHFIAALEIDNFDVLPGGVFNRGFIKAYARCCGADERELLSEYDQLLKQKRGPDLQLLPVDKPVSTEKSRPTGRYTPAIIAFVLIVIVGGFFYIRSTRTKLSPKPEVENAAVQPPPTGVQSPASSSPSTAENPVLPAVLPPNPSGEPSPGSGPETDTTGTSKPADSSKPGLPGSKSDTAKDQSTSALGEKKPPSTPAPEAQGNPEEKKPAEGVTVARGKGPISLQIAAKENTWLSIRKDGQEVYRKIMLSKETLHFSAKEKLEIVCGNAGGVTFTVDGRTLPPLGRTGEVKSVTYARPTRP
jgi:cytoskeleton protein RodZ